MSLDGYIASLKEQGLFDSGGAFTLDQARALQKLRRYQVASPAEFSAGLVASAVAAGADWVHIETRPAGFRLEHNGTPIRHDQMVTLFSSLMVGEVDRDTAAVAELAYGLNALLALHPTKIRVSCSGAEQLAVLELTSKQLVVIQAEPFESYGESQRTVIEAEGLWNGAQQILRRGLARRAEIDTLRQRCQFATIPILCDGRPLEFSSSLAPVVAVAQLGSPPPLPVDWPPALWLREGETHAWVGLSPEAPPSLTVVIHGVSFPVTDQALQPGTVAVVYSTAFSKDLSRSAVVLNEVYDQCLKAVTDVRSELLDTLCVQWRRIPVTRHLAMSHFFEKEARRARELWQTERADRLAQAARATRL